MPFREAYRWGKRDLAMGAMYKKIPLGVWA